jgi:hypothetical protein
MSTSMLLYSMKYMLLEIMKEFIYTAHDEANLDEITSKNKYIKYLSVINYDIFWLASLIMN